MKKLFTRLFTETEGQDLIEYALLAATIALGVTIAMGLVRDALQKTALDKAVQRGNEQLERFEKANKG